MRRALPCAENGIIAIVLVSVLVGKGSGQVDSRNVETGLEVPSLN